MRTSDAAGLVHRLLRRTGLSQALPMRMWHRSTIELQAEAADCGYICTSAMLAMFGRPVLIDEIKAGFGTTSRGLSLRQVRDALRHFELDADAVRFDLSRAKAYPCPGVALLERGHYIVIARRRGERFHIFDPQSGWYWTDRRRLARQATNLGVQVSVPPAAQRRHDRRLPARGVGLSARLLLSLPRARHVIAMFALGQALSLALPLLSMWSVDGIAHRFSLQASALIALGFLGISTANIGIALVANLFQSDLKRRAVLRTGEHIFDTLEGKNASWFDRNPPASLQHRAASVNSLVEYHLDVVRSVGALATTFLAGTVALLFISPWMLAPSFVFLVLSIGVDLLFQGPQRNQMRAAVEASQRRQTFVLDTLSQLPLFVRHGSVRRAKYRFKSLVRHSATVESRLQSIQGWRSATGLLLKSGEVLLFVSVSTAFLSAGHFSIGGFVALGAYKDLLAGAIASMVQLAVRGRSLQVHALQASALLEPDARQPEIATPINRGRVSFQGVSFAYGSLDKRVLHNVDLNVAPGECVVIRGASGTGKSTIAKLLAGALTPDEGRITVDGKPIARHMPGMSAILQTDRLIFGSVRDNVTLLRKEVSDSDVLEALRLAAIDDFVLSLPMGLNTVVGESVVGLSGGQRQRLLLARALQQKPRLLILDEATSSLDTATEAIVLRSLRKLETTLILVAHRPEVWELADSIYDLEGGLLHLIGGSARAKRLSAV